MGYDIADFIPPIPIYDRSGILNVHARAERRGLRSLPTRAARLDQPSMFPSGRRRAPAGSRDPTPDF